MQAGAHAGAVRAARAAAAGGRRVRVAGGAAARARAPACAPRAPADAPREPQRQGGRAQATLVRLRRRRGQPSGPQETLRRSHVQNLRIRIWRRTVLIVL